jgi:hypothetical protein
MLLTLQKFRPVILITGQLLDLNMYPNSNSYFYWDFDSEAKNVNTVGAESLSRYRRKVDFFQLV